MINWSAIYAYCRCDLDCQMINGFVFLRVITGKTYDAKD